MTEYREYEMTPAALLVALQRVPDEWTPWMGVDVSNPHGLRLWVKGWIENARPFNREMVRRTAAGRAALSSMEGATDEAVRKPALPLTNPETER